MRARFLAAAGDPGQLERLVAARAWDPPPRGWAPIMRRRGLFILAREGTPRLVFRDGAVLGTLFARDRPEPVADAVPQLERSIAASRGQVLVDRHWGVWFAIFADGKGHWALGDPSPFAPAYYRVRDGVSFYVSDLAAASELDPGAHAPDLDFLRRWITFPHLRTASTGLADMKELLPGTRRRVAGGRADIDIAWNPWAFTAKDRAIADFGEAASAVRREVLRTVPALARGRSNLLLELSGGLDSSIVAAALNAAGLPFDTVNFVTRRAEGDERPYARAVAALNPGRHFEIDEGEAMLELALPERQRLRPGLNPVMAPLHRQFADHGREVGAETYLTGAGGDNVFCYLTTAAPILDAWHDVGGLTALRTTLPEVAEMCGSTVWTTARFALRKALRALRAPPGWQRDTAFLHADAVPAAPEHHPWLQRPPGSPQGKREHMIALLRIQHVVDPETRVADLDFLHPLIAQPLMETCLRIPTWLWVKGGRNRAVARHAFRGLLPDEVLDRRSKGRLEGMCVRAWLRHKDEIADLLLGGALREAGLVDPDPLEAYLEQAGAPADALYFRIFELISAELWLRSWRR
jgi:asparagine synthase (glutamine-hydrolysing)